MLGVREAYTNRLIDKENISIFIPGIRIERGVVWVSQYAWTKLHEKTQRRRASRTAIRPKHNIILSRITSALEEVEEQMACFHVDVTGVGTAAD